MNDIDDPKGADLVRKRSRGRPPLPKGLKCLKCGTTDTPEWRVGETGPHTLCNACGLQYAKKKKWEIESKAKHSLKNILNDEEEREMQISAMSISSPMPSTPQSAMMIPQSQPSPSFHPPSSFQPSSFHPTPSFQHPPPSPHQSQFQPPFQQSSFQPSSFQPPSSFQQYQPSSQPPYPQNSNAQWVYSRDHSNKMQINQEMQSHLQHSSAIDMPVGSVPSISHSYINSYISTPSNSSSSSFSSINFSPFSLSSLSSASSGGESPYSPYSPHPHLR